MARNSIFALIDRRDVIENPIFATFEQRTVNSEAYYTLLGDVLLTRTSEVWQELLDDAEIPCIRLNSTEDLYTDPHLTDVGFFVESETEDGSIVLPRFPHRFWWVASPASGPCAWIERGCA